MVKSVDTTASSVYLQAVQHTVRECAPSALLTGQQTSRQLQVMECLPQVSTHPPKSLLCHC